MKTRSFAGAFLCFENEVILMKRGLHKSIAPGLWAGVGGHIEPDEMHDPTKACLREIAEETGILPADIVQIELAYFALIKTRDSLDSVYYFTARLSRRCEPVQSDEGNLCYVPILDGLTLPMAEHVKAFYRHFAQNPGFGGIQAYLFGESGEATEAGL